MDEACDGVLWASLSVKATKPYPQPGTCVEPDVGRVVAYISIGHFQNVIDMLEYVLDSFNKSGGLISLSLSMGIFLLFGCKGQYYIN